MVFSVSVKFPVLVSVTFCEALVEPSTWFPKLSVPGDAIAIGVPPWPLSVTVWGLPLALSVMVRVPLILPLVAGAKLTLIVQLAPPSREDPQLSVSENCWLAVMPAMERAKAPEFVSVTG